MPVSDAATMIRAMNDWSGKRVAVELRLPSGERLASIWGVLQTAGAYEFGAEAQGGLHFRVGDGEFSIDPRIVTGVAAPASGSGALVMRLHDNIELTITGPEASDSLLVAGPLVRSMASVGPRGCVGLVERSGG